MWFDLLGFCFKFQKTNGNVGNYIIMSDFYIYALSINITIGV